MLRAWTACEGCPLQAFALDEDNSKQQPDQDPGKDHHQDSPPETPG